MFVDTSLMENSRLGGLKLAGDWESYSGAIGISNEGAIFSPVSDI